MGSAATFCNPLDLAYRFQELRLLGYDRSVHREAADPSIVCYRDRYYMFASMSAGFWHSDDLVTWQYQPSTALPAFDYAPDVREVDGALIVTASRSTASPFFRSEDPLADDFAEVNSGFPFWDPHVFQDEDGETYFYWGCSNSEPIRGVRVDRRSFEPVGEPVELITSDVATHGWERTGENHVKSEPTTELERLIAQYVGEGPFIEGAWMTCRGGTYYLQYAAPGTEWNTYADGYYTGSSPLGPFQYSPASPFSAKPGGFITAAGHGSTFQDEYGNWWHASTMRISVHHSFERRIGIFPAGFDEDGTLFCNQNFADYPTLVPDRLVDPRTDTFAGWMLLSYRASASASSSAEGHGPDLAVNEDVRTWWAAGRSTPGEWLQIDLGDTATVHALQVNLADHELADLAPHTSDGLETAQGYRSIYRGSQATELLIELSGDGESWEPVLDSRGSEADTPHAFITLDEPRRVRHVRVTAGSLPFGGSFAVSGLRVFGLGDGIVPPAVEPVADRIDGTTASIRWEPVADAQGYNVRYGIALERLHHSWLLYDQTDLILRDLNDGSDYWVAVDSFNGNGITAGLPRKIE